LGVDGSAPSPGECRRQSNQAEDLRTIFSLSVGVLRRGAKPKLDVRDIAVFDTAKWKLKFVRYSQETLMTSRLPDFRPVVLVLEGIHLIWLNTHQA
jgi:hypothetical protein